MLFYVIMVWLADVSAGIVFWTGIFALLSVGLFIINIMSCPQDKDMTKAVVYTSKQLKTAMRGGEDKVSTTIRETLKESTISNVVLYRIVKNISLMFFVFFMSVTLLMPSKQTIYIAISAYAAKDVVEVIGDSDVYKKTMTIINLKLDETIKDMKTPAAK